MKTSEQIERTQAELKRGKPRSIRHAELHVRLRDLRLKQLRSEIRMERRKAA